jgi:DNA-3-methyladenine glycosylase
LTFGSTLPRSFYERPTLRVARDLLGATLVRHRSGEETTVGMIVEVEAYCGSNDLAAHSARGRRTARNEVMYGPGGHAYVYFIYGMYYCLNVVTRGPEVAEAILIRAAAPLDGIAAMRARRGADERVPVDRLARGPGVLCRAFAIDRADNGADLTDSALTIHEGRTIAARDVVRTPRIGIDYAGAWVSKPWRFLVRDHPAVSGPRLRRART